MNVDQLKKLIISLKAGKLHQVMQQIHQPCDCKDMCGSEEYCRCRATLGDLEHCNAKCGCGGKQSGVDGCDRSLRMPKPPAHPDMQSDSPKHSFRPSQLHKSKPDMQSTDQERLEYALRFPASYFHYGGDVADPRRKKASCRFFAIGKCKRGTLCRYIHKK